MLAWILGVEFSNRVITANSNNFDAYIKKKQAAFVIFHEKNCPFIKQFLPLWDTLADEYRKSITFLRMDISNSMEIVQRYPIFTNPSILLFQGGKYAITYHGEWNESAFKRICDRLSGDPIQTRTLKNSLDVFHFQSSEPSNLIIFNINDDDYEKHVFDALGPTQYFLNIAFCKNEELLKDMEIQKVPSIQISRPLDKVYYTASEFTPQSIAKRVRPIIQPVHHEPIFGNPSKTEYVFGAVFDTENPHTRQEVSDVVKYLVPLFNNTMSYQACNYMSCPKAAAFSGRTNGTLPIYYLFKRNSDGNLISKLYRGSDKSGFALRRWIRGLQKYSFNYNYTEIPVLTKSNFFTTVSNKKHNVILLIGDQNMIGYNEAYTMLQNTSCVLQQDGILSGFQFFTFNPLMEHHDFLSTSTDGKPYILIFPGGNEKKSVGNQYPSTISTDELINILRGKAHLTVTKRSDTPKQNDL